VSIESKKRPRSTTGKGTWKKVSDEHDQNREFWHLFVQGSDCCSEKR
jgi:hypothetical protein